MFIILKNIFIHIRNSLKIILTVAIATILIIGIISIYYKPTYSVTLNGEFIGYTNDKNGLQKQINDYMKGIEEQNLAFVDIETLPEYELCFVKRENTDSTEEILEKVKDLGTSYYDYYAIVLKNEEKYYVATKEEAEEVIDELKKKDSSNIDDLGYTLIYNTELGEYTDKDKIVASLYKKKVYIDSNSSATWGNGVSNEKLDLGIALIKPIASGYTITSRFGVRSSGNHTGLDVAAPTGTAIKAAASGTVTYASWSTTGYGNCIIISHGNGIETLYGHCSALYVSVGQYVEQGATIGAVGSTGNSTGPHLHLEIRSNGTRLNPQYYLY